jgi:hypothetical protein
LRYVEFLFIGEDRRLSLRKSVTRKTNAEDVGDATPVGAEAPISRRDSAVAEPAVCRGYCSGVGFGVCFGDGFGDGFGVGGASVLPEESP